MAAITYLLMFLLILTSVFLIVLVLIQRGKGGGLAGAFGGMGGQSAFGTKAGDLFTKITVGVAAVWIILCILTIQAVKRGGSGPLSEGLGGHQTAAQQPAGGPTPGGAPNKSGAPAQSGQPSPGGAPTVPAKTPVK